MRRLGLWVAGGCLAAAPLVGCGGDEARLKSHSDPLRAVQRTETSLLRLRETLTAADYSPVDEPVLATAANVIQTQLPYALGPKLGDAALKQQVDPQFAQLQKVFQERVMDPLWAEQRNLEAGRAGVEECLKLVGQLKKTLGG